MRAVLLGVAVVAGGLFLLALDDAPYLDPPEGLHAAVALTMAAGGEWVTPSVNGVRYLDTPPLLYWLTAPVLAAVGPAAAAARLWPAVSAVAVAVVTARIGLLLGGPRLGLLAGLIVTANLGIYVHARLVEPALPFVLCTTLSYAGFALAYRGGGRWPLLLFWVALGMATMTQDVLRAAIPLVVVALFLWITRERPLGPWAPWWGVLALFVVTVPWYAAVEAANRGFLWHTLVRARAVSDEDVSLGAGVFLGVTLLAFLPWAFALPWGFAHALRRPRHANGEVRWPTVDERLWLLFALAPIVLLAFFTLAPFRLPHDALPAFPSLALLAGRVWDDAIERVRGAAGARTLALSVAALYAVVAAAFGAAAAGLLRVPVGALANVDVVTRTALARGLPVPAAPAGAYASVLAVGTAVFTAAAVLVAVAGWRRRPRLAVGAALGAMLAFLPFAGQGMAQFARSRSVEPVADALTLRLRPGDEVFHEGPLENGASLLVHLDRPCGS